MTELEMKKVNDYILKKLSVKELNTILIDSACPPGYSPAYCISNCNECWVQFIKDEKQITLEQRVLLDILARVTGINFKCRSYSEAAALINNHKDRLESEMSKALEMIKHCKEED